MFRLFILLTLLACAPISDAQPVSQGDPNGIDAPIVESGPGPMEPAAPTPKFFGCGEVAPEFIGALPVYLAQHLNYPKSARKAGIQGKVLVRFVIDERGRVRHAQVRKGINPACDREALRLVRHMPRWKPGLLGGRKVKCYFTVPVVFRLPAQE